MAVFIGKLTGRESQLIATLPTNPMRNILLYCLVVPLIGMDCAEAAKRPDSGIVPDVLVKQTVDGMIRGTDQELSAMKVLIGRKK